MTTETKTYLEVFGKIPQVKGFFATKEGASEGSPYNRQDVFEQAGVGAAQLIWPQQVHKEHIQVIEEKPEGPLTVPETDGLLTHVPGVLLTTVHADCLPIYFYDPIHRAIGLVHAGWRGTAAGIGVKAVALMEKTYQSKPSDLIVYIGPGISGCCFEVGAEVLQEFKNAWAFADLFAKAAGSKYYMDLKGINTRQLREIGVKSIETSPHCTCCEPALFCSYRREGGTYQRMGAGLCLL